MDCKLVFLLTASILFGGMFLTCHGQNLPNFRCNIDLGSVDSSSFNVSWFGSNRCRSFKLIVYHGFTLSIATELDNVNGNNIRITELASNTVYVVRVMCLRRNNAVRGSTRCAVRTFDVGTTTTLAPTAPVPRGQCGDDRFTCADETCIPADQWCNHEKDCSEGEDEENCPGHCPKIDFDSNGNMTCTFFNSPESSCFFHCDHEYGWRLHGNHYTVCKGQKWSLAIPTCLIAISEVNAIRIGARRINFQVDVNVTYVESIELQNVTLSDGTNLNSNSLNFALDRIVRSLFLYELRGLPDGGALDITLVPVQRSGRKGLPISLTMDEWQGRQIEVIVSAEIHSPN